MNKLNMSFVDKPLACHTASLTPKPDEPELDGLRREGATPTQTGGIHLNL